MNGFIEGLIEEVQKRRFSLALISKHLKLCPLLVLFSKYLLWTFECVELKINLYR